MDRRQDAHMAPRPSSGRREETPVPPTDDVIDLPAVQRGTRQQDSGDGFDDLLRREVGVTGGKIPPRSLELLR